MRFNFGFAAASHCSAGEAKLSTGKRTITDDFMPYPVIIHVLYWVYT